MSSAGDGLGRQIATAQELATVVRAMKALAASSISQYERALLSLGDYQRTVELGLIASFSSAPAARSEVDNSGGEICAVLFGSDQGLVGRYNDVLFDYARTALGSLPGRLQCVWTIGARMEEVMTGAGFPACAALPVPNSVEAIAGLVDSLLISIDARIAQSPDAQIHVLHNRPLTGAAYQPTRTQLLPLDRPWRDQLVRAAWPTRTVPELVRGRKTLRSFIREYLFVVLFRASAEALASENASRLAAMQRAERNIDELRGELTLRYNRNRQESIDEELFEVLSGFEALGASAAPLADVTRFPAKAQASRLL